MTELYERILNALCSDCEAEREKNGTVPECWGQYGNPCAKYLNEMERLEMKEQDDEA